MFIFHRANSIFLIADVGDILKNNSTYLFDNWLKQSLMQCVASSPQDSGESWLEDAGPTLESQ